MAYQWGGRCYQTSADAVAAAFSSVVPTIDAQGDLHTVEWTGTVWEVREYVAGSLASQSLAPSPALGPCDPAGAVADAGALAWLVVAAWGAAWGINAMRRALA